MVNKSEIDAVDYAAMRANIIDEMFNEAHDTPTGFRGTMKTIKLTVWGLHNLWKSDRDFVRANVINVK